VSLNLYGKYLKSQDTFVTYMMNKNFTGRINTKKRELQNIATGIVRCWDADASVHNAWSVV
jgi:hypothetical protein